MIRLVGFESDSLKIALDNANNWLRERQKRYKGEFKYLDTKYSYANLQYSILIIYDSSDKNEEIDKDTNA